jgi:hypothetical protein
MNDEEESNAQNAAREIWGRPGHREKIRQAFDKRRAAGIKPTNTSAESTAAEILVAAELGLRGLIAERYSRAMPGVDVYAWRRGIKHSNGMRRVADIQVKYRHESGATNFDVDTLAEIHFLVAARANQGKPVGGRERRQIWIVPASEAQALIRNGSIRFSALKDSWLEAWHLIEKFCDES